MFPDDGDDWCPGDGGDNEAWTFGEAACWSLILFSGAALAGLLVYWLVEGG